jgi:hypothetical protein
LARILSRRELLAVVGRPDSDKPMSGMAFDRMVDRGALALTFGVPRAPTRDRYFATDPIFVRAVIEFARRLKLAQPVVAAVARLDNLTVLDAIVSAEAHPEVPLELALILGDGGLQLWWGRDVRQYLVGNVPHPNWRQRPPRKFEGATAIELTDLIASVRRRAERVGVDLSEPLFLSPGDPRWAETKAELMEIRERETSNVERAAALAALRVRVTEGLTLQ